MPTTLTPTLSHEPRRAAGRPSVSALRHRRRSPRVAPALAALAAAGVLLAARPTTAEAGPIYDMCVDLVDGWHSDCSKGAGNDFQQFGCDWVAGVGYIACGIIGAGELGWPIILQRIQ